MKNKIKPLTISIIAGILLGTVLFIVISALSTNSGCKHNLIKTVEKQATCVSQGIYKFKCSNCDYSKEETYTLEILSGEAVFDLAKDSAAEIITYDKTGAEFAMGSGFVYKNDGQIITNYHVIEEAYSADVIIENNKYPVLKVLSYDINRDIAVLKINATNLKELPICSQPLKTGSQIYAIGSSKGFTATFTQGIVTTSSRIIDNVSYIQHDAPISSGNSGGPLLNGFGEIVGINTMTAKESQNLNFAIAVKEIDNLSFSSPMTLSEVADKECNPFKKLKNHIINNGELSDDRTFFTVLTGTERLKNYNAIRGINYSISSNKLNLLLSFDTFFLIIEIDEQTANHIWSMTESSNSYNMQGSLNGRTFSSNSTYLSYSYTNIGNYSVNKSFNELAVSMAKYLLSYLTQDLSPINVTAQDLGFKNF